MELLLLLTSGLITWYCLHKKEYKRSILSIFCVLWASIFYLYTFRFFGLYDCKDGTFLMYLIGFASFFLGYIIIKPNKSNNSSKFNEITNKRKDLRVILLKCLAILSIYVLVKKSILAIPYWIAGGGGEVKSAIIQDDALNTGAALEILYTFLCRPIQIIMVIYAIVVIMSGLKDKSIMWLAVILTLSGYICSGSKFALIELAIMCAAYLWLFTKLSFRTAFNRYKYLFIGVSIILIFISMLMSTKDDGFLSTAYSYMCGCMPCSDNALNSILSDDNFYGLYSFNGILRAINLIPRYLGIGPDFKIILDIVWENIMRFENTMYISPTIKYNAFVSMFTFFYADGGFVGVFLLSFLFGLVCSLSLKYAYNRPTIYSCSLVLFLILLIFQSMVRFQLAFAPNAMALIYIILLLPRIKVPILNDSTR